MRKTDVHHQFLCQLAKVPLTASSLSVLGSPSAFRQILLQQIIHAQQRIFIVALYLENDAGGSAILEALYHAKRERPALDIAILVDWHRAQRGRIGTANNMTNAEWYHQVANRYPAIAIPIYGVPINTREALGVLHLKGFVIDDNVLYSGASLNNVYLHMQDKYRYDRYYLMQNKPLADAFVNLINQQIVNANAVQCLNRGVLPSHQQVRNKIRHFRRKLIKIQYQVPATEASNNTLSAAPLVGLGSRNLLNKTVWHLMCCTEEKLIICTPYFNLPPLLSRTIIALLRQKKQVEIIIGDKSANDFYIPPNEPFKVIGALPYLYELNLRRFVKRLQYYVTNQQLIVRLWKDGDNSFHLKGIWVDDQWTMITGNNLNPRAWQLDIENAILIHDPCQQISHQRTAELAQIRQHTTILTHYSDLESVADYPGKIRKLIRRLRRVRLDRIISRIL